MKNIIAYLSVLLLFPLAQCTSEEAGPQEDVSGINAQEAFFQTLGSLCGRQFHGKGVYPTDPEHELIDVNLLLMIETCEENEIRIPFHAGDDRSRTFFITFQDEGLHLRHDHRYEDGTPHEITNYGGYANVEGGPGRQFFEADETTANLLPEAATNVWMLETDPDNGTFVYYLERNNEPRFRAEFTIAE